MTRAISNSEFSVNRSTLFTLVLWMICLAIGIAGFVFPYTRPKRPTAAPPPVQAELIKVELTAKEVPPVVVPQSANLPQPPAIKPLAIPQTPPMIAIAEPSPQVVFALPVKAPARIVDVKSANTSKPVEQTTTPAPSATTVQTLTFGHGEGKQPAPDYPARAQREGQEGVVLVRFTVAENGRVLSAEAAKPSPWPLLNKEAVRVIRERWQFTAGGVRLYEIAIRFQMRK